MTRYILILAVSVAASGPSCDSIERLSGRVNSYYQALAENRSGSEFWSPTFRVSMGDPEELVQNLRLTFESVRLIRNPEITKSLHRRDNRILGYAVATLELKVKGANGITTKVRRQTTWEWLPDSLGFLDWYLVHLEDSEVPDP